MKPLSLDRLTIADLKDLAQCLGHSQESIHTLIKSLQQFNRPTYLTDATTARLLRSFSHPSVVHLTVLLDLIEKATSNELTGLNSDILMPFGLPNSTSVNLASGKELAEDQKDFLQTHFDDMEKAMLVIYKGSNTGEGYEHF